MRILNIAAAIGLMAGSLGLTTVASAQYHRDVRIENRADYNRHVLGRGDGSDIGRRYDNRRYDRHDRRDRRDWRRDGYRSSRNCHTEWRHHRRIRVCR